MVVDVYSVFTWYIVYELSIIGILPYLTVEGRSYRRANALLITLIVTMVSTCMMVLLCMWTSSNNLDTDRTWSAIASILVVLVAMTKLPSYPWYVWLPEAHVEASWPGSVILAAVVLKYSLIASGLFISTSRSSCYSLSLLVYLLLLSMWSVVLLELTAVDWKRIVAYMSVLHMNASMLSLFILHNSSVMYNDAVWLSHSVCTAAVFMLIGIAYAWSATRIVSLQVIKYSTQPILCGLLWLPVLMTMTDPPMVLSYITELGMLASSFSLSYILLAQILLILIVMYMSLVVKITHGVADSHSSVSIDVSLIYAALSCLLLSSVLLVWVL